MFVCLFVCWLVGWLVGKDLLSLEVIVVINGEGRCLCLLELTLGLCNGGSIHLHLWGSKSGHGLKLEVVLAREAAGEPEEGLFVVVVALGRDVVVLEVLLAVEGDLLWLDTALL